MAKTEAGLKTIEEIEVGDKVLAYNEATGEQAYKPVVRLFRNETKEWYHIFTDGEEMVCTGGHPFYVVGKGFIEARKLKVSEKLLLSSRKEVIIEKVEVETLTEAETTYNFEVADFHTYYVSDSKVLVHNMCKQEIVAGDENGWNAKVSVGGEVNHKTPHAHINWKNQKLASVDNKGNILVQSKMNKNTQRKMLRFIKDNMEDIVQGINKWY